MQKYLTMIKYKKLFLFFLLIFILILNISFFLSASSFGELKVTEEHPFLINGEWIPAKDLQVGDELTTIDGKRVRITSIQDIETKEPFPVYNLEAGKYSNFVVDGDGYGGLEGVVVHNSGIMPFSKAVMIKSYSEGRLIKNLKSPSQLGDLNANEISEIQVATDSLGQDLFVSGSAARSCRRNMGTNLPLAKFGQCKLGTRSDIDYLVQNGFEDIASGLNLPDIDPGWLVRGVDYLNLDKGQIIRFIPRGVPEIIVGKGKLNLPIRE
jgi:hypothetical protein